MLKRVVLLAGYLTIAAFSADAAPLGGPTCPATWTYGDRTLKLRWASIWAGWEPLAGIDGYTRDGREWQESERSRKHDEIFWKMQSFRKPAFLRCIYSNSKVMGEGPDVIVPIPDDSARCHTAWRDAADTAYVDSISCSPGKAPVPPISVAEPIGIGTDLEGMTLRQPRDHLAKVVAARGGIWKEAADGRTAEATFPGKGTRYRIRFAIESGLSREIAEIGPLPSERSDFIFAIQRRFGVYKLKSWKGSDDIQVEYGGGYENGQPLAPLEMRLVDTAASESRRQGQ